MDREFTLEYSKRSDDELLQLASNRVSLTPQADAALMEELRRRNLKESDRVKHQRSVKRYEQLRSKRKRRRILGRLTDGSSWTYLLQVVFVILLISTVYGELPGRFQLKPDWEEAAWHVMFATVGIAVIGIRQRTITFWMSLVISTTVHFVIVHSWIERDGKLSTVQGKNATGLGFVLFIASYFVFWILRRLFFSEESRDTK